MNLSRMVWGVRGWVAAAGMVGLALLSAACGPAAESTATTTTQQTATTATATQGTGQPTPTLAAQGTGTTTTAKIEPCPTKGVKELTAGGATFPFPLYSKMFDEYNKLCGVKVNYQSIGSGGGIRGIQERTLDFAGSDAIMTAAQQTGAKGGNVLHIASVAGAEAIIYNLPGVQRGKLKLDGPTLADIYLKKITKWNDPKIAALNAGVNLPNMDIAVVHRSDGSGTTFIFTNYLSKVSQEWSTKVGSSTSVNWPGDIGGQGNEGVTNQVKQIPGSIGYVELAYAKQNNLAWAQMKNKSGAFVEPSLEGASAAADVPSLPDNMQVMVTDSENPKAYPITGFTWLLVYENMTDAAKADAIARLAWWVVHEGQQYATPLEYAPLQGAAVAKDEVLIKSIKVNGQAILP